MRPAQESVPSRLCAASQELILPASRKGEEGAKGALLSRRRLGVLRIVPLRRRRREVWCSPTRPSPVSSSFSSSPARLERGAGARQAASESEPADRRKRGRGGSRDRRRRRQESQLGGRPPSSRPPRLGDKGGKRRQESSEDGLARGAEHDAAWGRPRPGSRRLRGLPGVARLEEAEAERGRRRGRGPTDFSLAEPALAAAM